MDAPAGDADLAMRTSVWHYAAFKRLLERLAPPRVPVWSDWTSTAPGCGPCMPRWGRAGPRFVLSTVDWQ